MKRNTFLIINMLNRKLVCCVTCYWLLSLYLSAQTIIISPQYDNVHGFSEELAAIKIKNLWGFIDMTGHTVIEPTYLDVRDFHEGLAAVKTSDGWGYIDKKNNLVIPNRYELASDFSEGLAGVKNLWGPWRFIDKKGEAFSTYNPTYNHYNEIAPFYNGIACVKIDNNSWNFIDKKGIVVVKDLYETYLPYQFSSGMYPLQGGDLGECGYKDLTGKWAIQPDYRSVTPFTDGVALVEEYGGTYHFIDDKGTVLATFQSMPVLLGDGFFQSEKNIYKIGNWDSIYYKPEENLVFIPSFYLNSDLTSEETYPINHFLPEMSSIGVGSAGVGSAGVGMSMESRTIVLRSPYMGVWAAKNSDKNGLWGFVTLNMNDFINRNVSVLMDNWLKKGEFESMTEYKKRTEETNIQQQMVMYANDLINGWLKKSFDKWTLSNYDANHQTYVMTTDIGQYIIKVEPQKAKALKDNWGNVKKEVLFAYNNGLTLKRISFDIPNTAPFVCLIDSSLEYDGSDVSVDISANSLVINIAEINNGDNNKQNKKNFKPSKLSEVDIEIPTTSDNNKSTFAFIIGNEQYQRVSQVPFAQNDAKILGEYCHKTLGMPTQNVKVYENATYGTMIGVVSDMQKIARAYKGKASMLFYYAGHGIPDETSNDGYLLPIDADGMRTEVCYSLNRLYRELGELQAKNVIVFVDACFSGAMRGNGMVVDARGVAIKVKNNRPTGNTIVFTAASDKQTAYPYEEKGHGLFTYFLLKKLHDTKGVCTLGELGDYVSDEVGKYAVVSNGKEQTPKVFYSTSVANCWKDIRLR